MFLGKFILNVVKSQAFSLVARAHQGSWESLYFCPEGICWAVHGEWDLGEMLHLVEMSTGYKHCCKAAPPTILPHKDEFLRHFIDFLLSESIYHAWGKKNKKK